MEGEKWSWDKVEAEFGSMTENDKMALYKALVDVSIMCKRCLETQGKDFNVHGSLFSRSFKREGHELGLQGYIDKEIASILSGKISQNIRSLIEEYESSCVSGKKEDCVYASKLSNEAYTRFTRLLNIKK